mmetsp:Transcript_29386/g.73806  ORF Transcript_29386/g.73806 Transcript_29386/m.73806 type:complete len:126 (-) Transcript_29386:273-650(-)
MWYDETTYCSDIVDNVCGDRYNLRKLVKAEATFLNAIRFKVVVSTKVFVRYFFALADLIHVSQPSRRRRRSSAPYGLAFVAGSTPLALLPVSEGISSSFSHSRVDQFWENQFSEKPENAAAKAEL